ncbi:MAG: hypothetical protein HJJLKODD_00147 [Phycisphaerae bacterium]|nr:hypothetical protein [Phycisphaerae bacterium]
MKTASDATDLPAAFSKDTAGVPVDPRALGLNEVIPGYLLHGGEIVIFALKPSVWFMVLVSVRWLFLGASLILLAPWIATHYPALSQNLITQIALIATAARLIIALLQWSSRLYILTNRRVMCCRGVIQVTLFEAPLPQISRTTIRSPVIERLCHVGSIGFAVQEPQHIEAWWEQISQPEEVHERIRSAIEKSRSI